jgi:hypothetical protein
MDNRGGFMLVDPYFNDVVDGVQYELTAERSSNFAKNVAANAPSF